ncbi:glycerate kinase [Mycolicibacterium aromaticivorans]|uniref:glycerate kinase family protein n=1 Tax=Mycolicibacterium aromaticivorans TaxID=318425 RepID=UPI0004B639D9|nr:glycerate kinase [Mycolicibacterium aromaticivorans]
MRVLIAPDCYGDSLTAVEAAQSIAAGWREARPSDELVLAPQSDGGPGFVGVLAGRLGEVRHTRVSGPLDDDVDAEWVDDRAASAAYIECAQACGLTLLPGPPTPASAVAAHSRGVGQLIDAALQAGAATIIVGLGGSSCSDGGRGMIEALGGPEQARARLAQVDLIAATDVEHPLLGPMGAARVFGPQKGADPDTVETLEQRMTAWALTLDALAGKAISPLPGAGAAGGLGAALLALGARRESGAAVIAEHTGLAADVANADVIITGEGRFDDQSLHGKVVSALAGGARARGVPVIVLAGQVTLPPADLTAAGITAAHAIADYAGSVQVAIDDAAAQLTGLARRTAAGLVG